MIDAGSGIRTCLSVARINSFKSLFSYTSHRETGDTVSSAQSTLLAEEEYNRALLRETVFFYQLQTISQNTAGDCADGCFGCLQLKLAQNDVHFTRNLTDGGRRLRAHRGIGLVGNVRSGVRIHRTRGWIVSRVGRYGRRNRNLGSGTAIRLNRRNGSGWIHVSRCLRIGVRIHEGRE